MELYLKARVPAKAAALICKAVPPAKLPSSDASEQHHEYNDADAGPHSKAVEIFSSALLQNAVEELLKIDLIDRAADLASHLGHWKRALPLYQ